MPKFFKIYEREGEKYLEIPLELHHLMFDFLPLEDLIRLTRLNETTKPLLLLDYPSSREELTFIEHVGSREEQQRTLFDDSFDLNPFYFNKLTHEITPENAWQFYLRRRGLREGAFDFLGNKVLDFLKHPNVGKQLLHGTISVSTKLFEELSDASLARETAIVDSLPDKNHYGLLKISESIKNGLLPEQVKRYLTCINETTLESQQCLKREEFLEALKRGASFYELACINFNEALVRAFVNGQIDSLDKSASSRILLHSNFSDYATFAMKKEFPELSISDILEFSSHQQSSITRMAPFLFGDISVDDLMDLAENYEAREIGVLTVNYGYTVKEIVKYSLTLDVAKAIKKGQISLNDLQDFSPINCIVRRFLMDQDEAHVNNNIELIKGLSTVAMSQTHVSCFLATHSINKGNKDSFLRNMVDLSPKQVEALNAGFNQEALQRDDFRNLFTEFEYLSPKKGRIYVQSINAGATIEEALSLANTKNSLDSEHDRVKAARVEANASTNKRIIRFARQQPNTELSLLLIDDESEGYSSNEEQMPSGGASAPQP